MIVAMGTFLGGLGLFLLAVSMITDGLKLSVGQTLKTVLARSTGTRLRGVGTGMLMTGIVQSSSAVTLATIGFVNAGLLSLPQSLGIVYGANVGTTVTGWLVAAVGFEFNIELLALPLIGLGMAARLVGASTRIGAMGEAIAGFGLFFVGVDFLQQGFAQFTETVNISALQTQGFWDPVIYVAVGIALTVATQSSSAAIAMTLTAATSGVLAIDAAAAMVIGANVGTTSTAGFAVIGATPNAKRVAAAHVLFNLITAAVALLLLPLMLSFVAWSGEELGLTQAPAVALALFHTTFNLLGALLILPMTDRIAGYLQGHFVTQAETLARPMHLDANVSITPQLGLDALVLELARMTGMARGCARQAISNPGLSAGAEETTTALLSLTDTVQKYVARFEQQRLPEHLSQALPLILRINHYLEEMAELTHMVNRHSGDIAALSHGRLAQAVAAFQNQAADVVSSCDPENPAFDATMIKPAYDHLHDAWHELKTNLLAAATRGDVPIDALNTVLDSLRAWLRITDECAKTCQRMIELQQLMQPAQPASASAEQ